LSAPTFGELRLLTLPYYRKALAMKCRKEKQELLDRHAWAAGILDIDDIPEEKPLVLYARNSLTYQYDNGNTQNQLDQMEEYFTNKGYKVVAKFKEIDTGKANDLDNRAVLKAAINKAKDEKAVLVAESLSRFIRNEEYHPIKNWKVQPTKKDLGLLDGIRSGVVLATLLPLDVPPTREKGIQTIRGQRIKNKYGGRPKKKRGKYTVKKKELLLPKIIEMLHSNYLRKDIAKKLKISRNTIRKWLKEYRKGKV
jgi:DNA invertase Pin-like site-specific DNA recombinase